MAYTLLGAPMPQFLDNDGAPLSGGLLYVYEAGTSTPATTYSDSTGATPNANPIVLDAAGRPDSGAIYLPAGSYKYRLTDAEDLEIWTQDNHTVADPA